MTFHDSNTVIPDLVTRYQLLSSLSCNELAMNIRKMLDNIGGCGVGAEALGSFH